MGNFFFSLNVLMVEAVAAFGFSLLDCCLFGDFCLFMEKIFGLFGRMGLGTVVTKIFPFVFIHLYCYILFT